MSNTRTVEERLCALERDMRIVQQELARLKAIKRGNWIEAIGSRSMTDEDRAADEEFMKICRELREADRPPDDE
jgi:hypothetical protein